MDPALHRPQNPSPLTRARSRPLTLLRERLFDRLDLWVFPLMLGVGKKVFDGGVVPANLTLLEPPVASSTGAVLLRYGLGAGTPGTGDMRREDRGTAQS
ncbi:hypothetical protein ACFY4C_39795 [Actinomadura viridis]|uniref:hypothetical protein n=1 Tax=Actinomadura viridis TaxID=58110 RepID=UPI0036C9F70A